MVENRDEGFKKQKKTGLKIYQSAEQGRQLLGDDGELDEGGSDFGFLVFAESRRSEAFQGP